MALTDAQKVVRNDTAKRMATALEGIETALGGLGTDNAKKTDLTSISATGTTNATGATITAGTYFYLNGALVQAKTDIASGATFTTGTNYDAVTAGGLNSLNAGLTSLNSQYAHARKTDFSLTDLQAAVADQNLEKYGLKPGDQKTINGRTYVISGLNVMKGTHGYTCTNPHVGLIVIPHTTCAWNASGNTYTGADNRGAGYKNCDLHYYLKNTVKPWCDTDLGSGHLYSHYKLLSNAVNASGYNRFGSASGCASGWDWEASCFISALTEMQVYGGTIWSSSGYDTGEANQQLPVFQRYKFTEIFGNEYPWLRDVASASLACYATGYGGLAYYGGAAIGYCVAGLILYH